MPKNGSAKQGQVTLTAVSYTCVCHKLLFYGQLYGASCVVEKLEHS